MWQSSARLELPSHNTNGSSTMKASNDMVWSFSDSFTEICFARIWCSSIHLNEKIIKLYTLNGVGVTTLQRSTITSVWEGKDKFLLRFYPDERKRAVVSDSSSMSSLSLLLMAIWVMRFSFTLSSISSVALSGKYIFMSLVL